MDNGKLPLPFPTWAGTINRDVGTINRDLGTIR
jgi:hypothetical protein